MVAALLGLWLFSLKATEKIFSASNILFDAYKLKCYNQLILNTRRKIYEGLL